jgi:hypothetical protein
MTLNKFFVSGRIDSVPWLRKISTGKSLVSFTLRCESNSPGKSDDLFTVIAWNKSAEYINDNMHQGTTVWVAGSVRKEGSYNSSSANPHHTVVINSYRVGYLSSPALTEVQKDAIEAAIDVDDYAVLGMGPELVEYDSPIPHDIGRDLGDVDEDIRHAQDVAGSWLREDEMIQDHEKLFSPTGDYSPAERLGPDEMDYE